MLSCQPPPLQQNERLSRKTACSHPAATRSSGHARNARDSFSGRIRGGAAVGGEIFIPIAIAILVSFVLSPPILLLRRWGLGRVISVLTIVFAALPEPIRRETLADGYCSITQKLDVRPVGIKQLQCLPIDSFACGEHRALIHSPIRSWNDALYVPFRFHERSRHRAGFITARLLSPATVFPGCGCPSSVFGTGCGVKIRETLARLVCDVMRLSAGAASGDLRWSVV